MPTASTSAAVRQRARSFLDNPDAQPRFYTDEVEQPRKDGSTVWIEVVTTYCRNPRTGKTLEIKAAKSPKFRPGKGLKDALN